MARRLNLELNGSPVDFMVRRVIVAGYTGRDEAQVRAHILELEREGIPHPESVPAAYLLAASAATTDNALILNSEHVSGEAEPALLFRSNTVNDALVSVIVDFTDRHEERRSIPRSKIHPKPLSNRVWEYAAVAAAWDDIALRSYVGSPDVPELYQSGTLAQLLPPVDLLARLGLKSELEGTVLLMGTLPLLRGKFSFTDYFACELETPEGSTLSYACTIHRESLERYRRSAG